jgi:hypothetical protein
MYHKESPIASDSVQVIKDIITLSPGHHCCISRKKSAFASDGSEQGEVGEDCNCFSPIGHDDRRARGPRAANPFACRRVKLLDCDALGHCVTVSLSGLTVKCNGDASASMSALSASQYANISSQASSGKSQFSAASRGPMPLVSASSHTADAKGLRPLTQICRRHGWGAQGATAKSSVEYMILIMRAFSCGGARRHNRYGRGCLASLCGQD